MEPEAKVLYVMERKAPAEIDTVICVADADNFVDSLRKVRKFKTSPIRFFSFDLTFLSRLPCSEFMSTFDAIVIDIAVCAELSFTDCTRLFQLLTPVRTVSPCVLIYFRHYDMTMPQWGEEGYEEQHEKQLSRHFCEAAKQFNFAKPRALYDSP